MVYDLAGRLTSVTDAVSNATTFAYDNADRLTSVTDALSHAATTTYDSAGRVASVVDRNGRKTAYTYDNANRLVAEDWLSQGSQGQSTWTIAYGYDNANRLTSITDSSATYAMTYDAEGRLATVSNTNTPNVPQTTLTYTYNTRDDRTALADNRSGSVAYSYDNAHRLTETRMTVTGQSVSPKVVLGYDNANRLTSLSRTNANAYSGGATVATALTFDAASRPTAISHTAGGNTLASYTLGWDAGNQISSEVSGDGTVNYTYDNAGQLTAASGYRSESYSYDATGNRTMTGYSTGTGNRLASDGTFNYSYDYDGNLVTKTEISTGKVSEFVWDYRNRLTNVRQRNSSGGAVVQEQIYRYDPMDRRIGVGSDPDGAGSQPATWQWTVYDGQNPYADFDNSGSLTNRFLSGDAVDQLLARFSASGTAAWYLTDQLGSVRDIANTSRSVIDHIKYDSFGKVLTETSPTNGDRFKYTGRELDPTTGQYNYRARYYDAAMGRFTSEDPTGLSSGDTNIYRYTGNSPTNRTDPSGEAWWNLGICDVGYGLGTRIGDGWAAMFNNTYLIDMEIARLRQQRIVSEMSNPNSALTTSQFAEERLLVLKNGLGEAGDIANRAGDGALATAELGMDCAAVVLAGKAALVRLAAAEAAALARAEAEAASRQFQGPAKPWLDGATPNSTYTHIDPKTGKAVQNAIYDKNGDVIGHVDFKNHGGAPSGHGHQLPQPGNPASGHGPGTPHIPNN